MYVNVVGTRRVDIVDEKSDIHGYSCYCTFEDRKVDGLATQKIFVSDKLLNSCVPGQVPCKDSVMEFEYNAYGKIGFIKGITITPPGGF